MSNALQNRIGRFMTESTFARTLQQHWLAGSVLLLAVLARVFLLKVIPNTDVPEGYGPWYDEIVQYGRVKAWGRDISDYAPPYLYLLSLASLLPFHKFVNIKLVPLVFDLWAAWLCVRLVKRIHPVGPIPMLAGLLFLLGPTVMANSALWGQVDVIYMTFLLLSLIYVLDERPTRSVLAFSLALAFKLQAAFFLPALVVLFLERGWRLWRFALAPVGYLLLSVPAILAGRAIGNTLTVYLRQVGSQGSLEQNAASIYQWLPSPDPQLQARAGIVFAAAVCGFFIAAIHYLAKNKFDRKTQFSIAMLMAALPPFLLPNMHERYAYCSDVLATLTPFVVPSLTLPAGLLIFASLASYGPFLRHDWLPLPYAAAINAVALYLLAKNIARTTGMISGRTPQS
ncbi:MAG: glycosyltransferase 87 family protein [Deltaproteobacteria bacterium]|nr:glycosyltransferase 87 family protein [Deltaproteobacteria bacterium]